MNYHAPLESQICYHIYNRTISDTLLFREASNYHFFLQKWQQFLGNYFATYAYCLLPNHFHVLAKVKSPNPKVIEAEDTQKAKAYLNQEQPYHRLLESQFKRFFNSYAMAYNKQYERHGSLFQAKFKRIAITDEAHFRYLLWYIHHNPIHHGYTVTYEDWAFSSYKSYVGKVSDTSEAYNTLNVATSVVLKRFQDRDDSSGKQNFQAFHEANKIGSRKASFEQVLKVYGIDV